MSNPMTTLIARLRRFMARREGNTAIIFGLAAIPVVVAAGMAVDVTRAYMVKERLSASLDAASLAVGSQSGLSQTELQTKLQNYFLANYPSSALGRNITVQPVDTTNDPNGSLSAQIINYQAQATVDMSFMQLVGVSNITVTATAQTHRGFGLEVALVLDNTGSMLCGNSDGAPNYQDSLCGAAGSVIASDITCANSGNLSRICQLRQASLNFVNILTGARPAPSQLYIGVVPYVTTVNVSALCSGQFNCSHVTTGPTATTTTNPGSPLACNTTDFTDQYGFIIDAPFTAWVQTTSTSTGTSNVKITTGSTANLAVGMVVQQLYTAPNVNFNNTNNVWDPMTTGNVVPSLATITNISGNTLTITPAPTGLASNVLIQFGFTGITDGTSANVTGLPNVIATALANNTALPGSPPLANAWTISGTGIPGGTGPRGNPERTTTIQSVTAATGTSLASVTLCQPTTAAGTQTMMLYNPIWFDQNSTPVPGSSTAATNPGSSQWMGCVVEVTSGGEMVSGTGALTYNAVTTPDETEPNLNESWYPFWWIPGETNNGTNGLNNWIGGSGFNSTTGNSIIAQTNANPGGEIQGKVVTDWDTFPGPNQGCPVPILPLTDVTTANPNGVTQVQNTINQMWPRDAGGTQVGVGMIWGWRVLSPNGPFPQNNGHPLTYTQESNQVWKKVVVLMTDGTEEWPSADQLTGEGFLQDGKLNTTSNTNTAVTNIGARLQTICTNMAQTGNFVIYTVGLGTDGQNNAELQTCATGPNNVAGVNNGGFFVAATTSNLNSAFQQIANSILTLRLSQ